jgi:PAS domain S-box-containing protein
MRFGAVQGKTAILRAALPLLGLLLGLLAFDLYIFAARFIPSQFTRVTVAPLYVPVAVILAVLLLTPPRRWWPYLVMAYAFQVALYTWFGYPLGFNLVAEAPTVLEPLIAAYLLYRLHLLRPQFASLRALTLYACCVITAVLLSALLGAGLRATLGFAYWPAWLSWLLGDSLATLVLAPALVLWVTAGAAGLRIPTWRQAVEIALWCGLFVLVGFVALDVVRGEIVSPALIYVPVPLLLWAAVRFGPRGLASALAIYTVVAIIGAAYGTGPFAGRTTATNVLTVQLFLAAIGMPLFFLAALIQERAAANDALRTSEARYRTVVETQTELITRYKPDTTLTFVNDATCRFDGKAREELLGTSILAEMPEEAAARVQSMIATLLAEPEPGIVTIEHEARFHDGSLHWQQWVNRTILDADGQVIELQGIGRDITERKQAEEALRLSEERYRDLVESQTEMLCRYLPDTTLTFVNDAFCRGCGRPRSELVGRKFLDFMDPPTQAHHLAYLTALLAHPQTSVDEHQVMLPDGSMGWQQWVDHVIYDDHRNIIEIQSIGRDITDRKRAEQAQRESEARFRAAFESAAIGMVLVGLDGHPLEVNRPVVEMLGYSEDELRAHAFADFTVPEDVEPNLTLFRQAVAGELDSYQVEKQYRHKDGHVVWGHLSAGMVRDAAGTPRYVVGHVQDITERKQMEREQTRLLEIERATRRQLEAVLDVLPAAVAMADAQGKLLQVNQAFRATWGAHALAGSIKDYRIYQGWHPDGKPMATEDWALARALRHGETVRGQEVEIQAFDGRRKTILDHAAPLWDGEGRIAGGVVSFVDISERKALQRERTRAAILSAQSQEFQTLADHSPDVIVRLDPSGRHRYVNPAAADLFGLPAEQWIGQTCAELGIPPELSAPWDEARQEVVATRTPRTFDMEIHAPGALMQSLHTRFVPELDKDGMLRSVLAIATDVSALKQAQARQAEQASRLDAIIEAIADAVLVHDAQGHVLRVNQAYRSLVGLETDPSYVARPLLERVQRLGVTDEQGHPLPAEDSISQRVLRGEELTGTTAVDQQMQTLDGRHVWINTAGMPIRGPEGQITGVVLVMRDVTARRALERAVTEQASQLEAIFEAQSDGVAVYSASGQLVRVNQAGLAMVHYAAELFGLSADPAFAALPFSEQVKHVYGQAPLDAAGQPIPHEALPARRAIRGETLTGQNAVDERFVGPDGRAYETSVTAAPIRDAAGQIVGAVVVARDVTARRQLEQRLAQQERQYRSLVENGPDIITRYDHELRYRYVSPRLEAATGLAAHALLDKRDADFGPVVLGISATEHETWVHALMQAVATGERQVVDCELRRPDGVTYYLARLIPEKAEDGSVESVLTVTTDITALRRTETALRAATVAAEAARQAEERRKQIAESLRGVLAVLNSTQPPQEVLQYIVRQAQELLGSGAAVIYGPDHLTESTSPGAPAAMLRVQAAQGLRIAGRRPPLRQRLPFTEAAVEQALTSAQPVALVKRNGRPLTAGSPSDEADGAAAIPLLYGSLPAPYQALLTVPIRIQDGVYGCLVLFYTQPHHFAAEEVALAQAYADQVAQAITNARLQAQREQAAAEAERNRLASELHDTVTQEIFSASLLAENLPKLLPTHREQAEAGLQHLHALTQSALAGLRALLLELRPGTLEHVPLSDALQKLGAAISLRAAVPIVVDVEGEVDGVAGAEPLLPAAVKVAFYRVAQEALMNAAKHAKAHSIRLRLRTQGKRRLELEIADDGRGFHPRTVPAGHFGLAIMHERAQGVDAQVQVRSQVGQGTTVVMTWRRGQKASTPEREAIPAGHRPAHQRQEVPYEEAKSPAGGDRR